MLLISLVLLLSPMTQEANPNIACKTSLTTEATQPELTANGKMRCSDGAIVDYEDMHVETDWMEYDPATKVLTAGDHVHFVRGTEDLRGGRLAYNIETKTGTFADVHGDIEGFYLKTGQYERLPDGKWSLTRPTATACKDECPSWHFTFRDALITPGEKVSGRGVAFRFRNVPILYFPKFSVPTEHKERSSGFLIPSYSASTTKGRSIRETFYWVMGRSYDTSLTAEYFTKRGPSGTIDFRGLPTSRSSIDVNTLFAIDRQHQGGYRTRIRAFAGLGEDWRAVAKVDTTSSFEFRQVYEEGFSVISNPIEQSTAFLTRNGARSSLNFLYNRTAVFYPGTSTVLRTFPSVDLQLPTNDIGGRIPVYFSFDGSLNGMARRDTEVSTPPLMQRLDLHPSVQIPVFRSSAFTLSNDFALRETVYTHSLNPDVTRQTLSRGLFDYTMKITGPQLEKSYGKWSHQFEPTIQYRYVTGVDDFERTIKVDETDLVTDTNEIEYGITNHFFTDHEFLTWRIAQKMYFEPTFGGALTPGTRNTLEPLMDLTGFAFSAGEIRRFSPLVSLVRIAPVPWSTSDIQVDYDTQRGEFRGAGVLGGFTHGLFNSSVGYFFNKRTEIQAPRNQIHGLVTIGSHLRRGFSGGVAFSYDIYSSLFQGSTAQVGYNAECYGLSFEFTQYAVGARRETGWRISLSLKNLGSIGTMRPQERFF